MMFKHVSNAIKLLSTGGDHHLAFDQGSKLDRKTPADRSETGPCIKAGSVPDGQDLI